MLNFIQTKTVGLMILNSGIYDTVEINMNSKADGMASLI